MGKYVIKRVLYIVLVFFILSFLLFMIYNMLPVDKAAEAARNEITANKRLNYEERYTPCQVCKTQEAIAYGGGATIGGYDHLQP